VSHGVFRSLDFLFEGCTPRNFLLCWKEASCGCHLAGEEVPGGAVAEDRCEVVGLFVGY
jgi:hypothetical protein